MSLPKLSIRLEVLPGATVGEQIANAAAFGFDAIALPGRFKDRWLEPLRQCLRDLPLPLASISLGFSHSLLSPTQEERRKCRDSLIELLDLCAELGAGLLNVPPCLIQDNPDRIRDAGEYASLEERLDALLLEQLAEIGDAAEARGVWFLLEPVNRYESDYLNSIEHAANLARRLNHPAVGVTADFFHMQLEELDPAAAIARAMPTIRHVHVAENTRVEPGPGTLDLRLGFGALKSAGYAGLLEVECRRLSGPAAEVLPRSARYLRETWAQA